MACCDVHLKRKLEPFGISKRVEREIGMVLPKMLFEEIAAALRIAQDFPKPAVVSLTFQFFRPLGPHGMVRGIENKIPSSWILLWDLDGPVGVDSLNRILEHLKIR